MEIIDAGRVRLGVSATRISGRDYIDIRQYYTDAQGMLRPTSNGSLLPVECCAEIKAAMDVEYEKIQRLPAATLLYFMEKVEDKKAIRRVAAHRVFTSAKEAVRKTPKQQGSEAQRGYIFKCSDYELVKGSYLLKPTAPFAVWDTHLDRWVRFDKQSKPDKRTQRPLEKSR